MKLLHFPLSCVLISILVLPHSASAAVYVWRDAKGVMNFSDMPSSSRARVFEPGSRSRLAGFSGAVPARVREELRRQVDPLVQAIARAERVDPALVHAVIAAESGYNARAVSVKGAAGLMQLMPDTARRYGVVNRFDPGENIRGGAAYLSDLLALFRNDMELAIAAYNAGENAVLRNGNRIPSYPETQAYVPRVLAYYRQFRG